MLDNKYKEFFRTLGNKQRIEIVLCLLKGDKNVSEISKCLRAEQSTISHNLKRLLQCSFITMRPSGKERIYSANKSTIVPLFNLIKKHANKYCQKLCCK